MNNKFIITAACFLVCLFSFDLCAADANEAQAGYSIDTRQNNPYGLSQWQRKPQFSIVNERSVYEATWRAKPYQVWPSTEEWWDMHLKVHKAEDLPQVGPWAFNWIVRRHPCFMVSGDAPRFSLVETPRNKEINPRFYMMGELRIRCSVGEQSFWLDERGKIKTVYYPWGTVHQVDLRPELPLQFKIQAVLAENCGIVVEVLPIGDANKPLNVELGLYYGGLDSKFINFFPEYFIINSNDSHNDTVELNNNMAKLADPNILLKIFVSAEPTGTVEVDSGKTSDFTTNRIVFKHKFSTGENIRSFRVLACKIEDDKSAKLSIGKFDEYVQQTKNYYDEILNSVDIKTPDTVLNTGFYASVVNLDYTYQPPGWFEGIHEWNSYFLNNYHMSAAVALGQFDRARDGLMLSGGGPKGPAQVLVSDGSIFEGGHSTEDGLPYFILQLYRYWLASGDMETLNKLWEPTCKNLDNMFNVRDPEGDLLLNFHQACNAFLYQADHLALPGDAISPTMMMAGDLELMAKMADARGETDRARNWRLRSEYMLDECVRRLWLPGEGRFAAAIDYQGQFQHASYYTDYVFPILYTDVAKEYSWMCLKAMDNDLWPNDRLMGCGNFKPDLFGNNAIHPLQMSEASEAYFKAGRSDRGWTLLHSTALSATVLTDSPGSFPEFSTRTGYGLPDYGFSNPAAAYLNAVVSGLFGVERTSADKPLIWHPSIPSEWPGASLKVSGISVSVEGTIENRAYNVALGTAKPLAFSLPLSGYKVQNVTDVNGNKIEYKVSYEVGGGNLEMTLPAAIEHKFKVYLKRWDVDWGIPKEAAASDVVEWKLPFDSFQLVDPQNIFEYFRIDGRVLKGKLTASAGRKTFFLINRTEGVNMSFDLNIVGKSVPAAKRQGVLKGKREGLVLKEYFDSESINGKNFWRFGQHKFDFSKNVKNIQDDYGEFDIGESVFDVRVNGKNMIQIETGFSDATTLALHLSGAKRYFTYELNKKISGLEFLAASECQIRLTGMQIGRILLRYSDGYIQIEPLIYGVNIDSSLIPHAKETTVYKLEWAKFVYRFSVDADATRQLQNFSIEMFMPDSNIGIFAINSISHEE